MNRTFPHIFALIFFFLLPTAFAKDLEINPSFIDIQYTLGNPQPSSINISIHNRDNSSFALSLSLSGLFMSLSSASFYFNETETRSFSVSFNIPSSTNPQMYTGQIIYGTGTNEYIPVYINVKRVETGCKIIMDEDYRYSINKEIKPYTEDFSFKIASACTQGVTITNVKEDKVFTMTNGKQPIRLTGSVPNGEHNGGETLTYTIEYDVSELATATYSSSIILSAIDKATDTSISKIIKYQITVVGSNPTPYNYSTTSIGSYPSCNVESTSLLLNNTYQLLCTNVVDPNVKFRIEPDSEYLEGVKVEPKEDMNQFIWHFKAKKLGNTKLKLSFELMGVPLGPVYEYDLGIVENIGKGTTLKFDLYGPGGKISDCSQLKTGETLTVLLKDNSSDNIISGFSIYRDGAKMDSSSFLIEEGHTYTLSASAPGYNSIETECKAFSAKVEIFISVSEPELGQLITITTNPPENVSLMLDGTSIGPIFNIISLGEHTITASAPGYQPGELKFTPTPMLAAISPIPEDLELGKETSIELNKIAGWVVYYSEENGTEQSAYKTETSQKIIFTPEDKGLYTVVANGKDIASWDKSGSSFFSFFGDYWGVFVVLGLIVIILLYFKFTSPKKSKFNLRFSKKKEMGDVMGEEPIILGGSKEEET